MDGDGLMVVANVRDTAATTARKPVTETRNAHGTGIKRDASLNLHLLQEAPCPHAFQLNLSYLSLEQIHYVG